MRTPQRRKNNMIALAVLAALVILGGLYVRFNTPSEPATVEYMASNDGTASERRVSRRVTLQASATNEQIGDVIAKEVATIDMQYSRPPKVFIYVYQPGTPAAQQGANWIAMYSRTNGISEPIQYK